MCAADSTGYFPGWRDRARRLSSNHANHGGFMLRLIKLAVYAGAAYALYEVVQGMLDESRPREAGGRRGGSRDLDRALNDGGGRMEALTAGGFGQRVQTLD